MAFSVVWSIRPLLAKCLAAVHAKAVESFCFTLAVANIALLVFDVFSATFAFVADLIAMLVSKVPMLACTTSSIHWIPPVVIMTTPMVGHICYLFQCQSDTTVNHNYKTIFKRADIR